MKFAAAANENIKRLFQAFRDYDDEAFLRIAEGIISELISANKHSEAKELQKALSGIISSRKQKSTHASLNVVATTHDEKAKELLLFLPNNVDANNMVLEASVGDKIARIQAEYFNRSKLQRHGLNNMSRVLFWGPPGCGKTMTAYALGKALGLQVAVLNLSGILSSYLGDTSSNLQKVFDYIEQKPVILLIDEFDSLAKTRTDSMDVGELKRIVNSLLQLMDTYSAVNSIVIACSNHQHLLDEAIWRRFDEIVHFDLPSRSNVAEVFKLKFSGIKFKGNFTKFLPLLNGMSFADVERISNIALKNMILSDSQTVTEKDLGAVINRYKSDLEAAKKSSVERD